MIKGFSTKKIKSQKTLGETLKGARCKKNLTLLESENATKVRAKYLAALENSDWDVLPQEVYVRAFILAYAKFLNLEVKKLLSLYASEVAIRNKNEKFKISYNQSLKDKKVLITPKVLAYSALSCVIVVMISYIIFQVFSFAGTPDLQIMSPANNSISENDAVDLNGVTEPDSIVVVNEENVPVTKEGQFSLKLKLHRGVNVVKVKAVNKAKKESSEVYTIEYKPKTASIENKNE